MPYVDVLWKPEHLEVTVLEMLVERIREVVGGALTAADPLHLVTPSMVDVRVSAVGPYDRIGPDLYVTVLARTEPDRDRHKVRVVGEITEALTALDLPADTLIELVLTNRASAYEYGE